MPRLPDWKQYRKKKQEEIKLTIQPRWSEKAIYKRLKQLLNEAMTAHYTGTANGGEIVRSFWAKLPEHLSDLPPDEGFHTFEVFSSVWEDLLHDDKYRDFLDVLLDVSR